MYREKTRTVWEERFPEEPFHLPHTHSDKEHLLTNIVIMPSAVYEHLLLNIAIVPAVS